MGEKGHHEGTENQIKSIVHQSFFKPNQVLLTNPIKDSIYIKAIKTKVAPCRNY